MGPPDGASPDVDPRGAKLDRVASTLIGAVAAVGGLLAVFGVNSDRINLLLDDAMARKLLIAAGVCAVLAVCLSLLALMAGAVSHEVALLAGGATAYVAGLLFAIFAAAGAADYGGHPSFTHVVVEPGPPATLTVTLRAGSLDENQRVAVRVTDGPASDVLYTGTMRPDSAGRVEQDVDVPVPEGPQHLLLQAWRLDRAEEPPACGSDRALIVCVSVAIP